MQYFPDAVTVVLNNMMKAFVEMEEIPLSQVSNKTRRETLCLWIELYILCIMWIL